MTEPITLCELELPKEYKPGTIVEHFKRQHSLTQDEIKNKKYLYRIIGTALHTETQEKLVIYQSLYDDHQIFARPIKMFMENVDPKKYPWNKLPARFAPYTHDLIVQDLNHLDSAVVEIAGGGSKYKYVYIWRTNNGYHYCFYDDLYYETASEELELTRSNTKLGVTLDLICSKCNGFSFSRILTEEEEILFIL